MGTFEDCLGQHRQQAAAEYSNENPRRDVADPEIHTRPDEVDNDAQIGELDGKPHVRPARQQLKLTTGPFGQIQNDRIDISHLPWNKRTKRRYLERSRLQRRTDTAQAKRVPLLMSFELPRLTVAAPYDQIVSTVFPRVIQLSRRKT
jgi:hypothetical protein